MKENKAYKVRDKAVNINSNSYEAIAVLYDFIEKGLIINVKEDL